VSSAGRPAPPPIVRVWPVTACLVLLGAAAAAPLLGAEPVALGTRPPLADGLALLAAVGLAILFGAAQVATVWIPFRRQAHAWTMSEAPLVLGLALLAPGMLLLAQLVGRAIAVIGWQRQQPVKWTFNLALWWLETAVAIGVHRLLAGGADVTSPRGIAALVGAVACASIIGTLAVPLVIRIVEAEEARSALGWILAASGIAVVANTSLGVVAVVVAVHAPAAAVALAVVSVALLAAYRAYGERRRQHEDLQRLYALTSQGAPESLERGIERILRDCRDLLRAERAIIVLGGEEPRVVDASEAGTTTRSLAAEEADELHRALTGGALLLPRAARRHRIAGIEARDLVAVSPRGAADDVAALLVADGLGDVRTFSDGDLRLLETLANHVGVTLRNGRLVERLQAEAEHRLHQALHDELTGLPSRTHFLDAVEQAIAEVASGSGKLAVLLIDLDHFKEINDTLGHHVGDEVLVGVADAFRAVAKPTELVARLGGDEFAVLVRGVGSQLDAISAAARYRESLNRPFGTDGMRLEVIGSVGVAVAPQHGSDVTTLLRAADVAMYEAKARRSGVECYASERDSHSPRRLSLLQGLRAAIEQPQLLVHYQPKANLPEGEVTGVEALVRWHHPVHGFVPPEEFIGMAEHAGLIRPLTSFVLAEVGDQLARWRRAGLAIEAAVNLSTWNLLDLGLVGEVDALLESRGLPPEALRLEITESSVMADPHRTAGVLRGLRALGVRLSLDDFGTGYSSLAWLRQLPVDEVKLDRSFIAALVTEPETEAIVRATIELGRTLGLRVLAEGVEDLPTWERLDELGCDGIQGFLLSRPLAAGPMTEWLQQHRSAARPALLRPELRVTPHPSL
jgi:diguanylate cyclase (GGDEF)-like protein